MPRRHALALLAGLLPGMARADNAVAGPDFGGLQVPGADFASQWAQFRDRFLSSDGRIIDTGNGGVSHSEGQGYGLLFSLRAGDRGSFALIQQWTSANLREQSSGLHAWRYDPYSSPPVSDANNATDGDFAIAWALIEAGKQWQITSATDSGLETAAGILRKLVVRAGGHSLLLPGVSGFDDKGSYTLNPSYYLFPAFATLSAALPDPAWLDIAGDGLRFLAEARFGTWGLSPDWCAVSHGGSAPTEAPGRTLDFSYDAIRVPLYLAWAGIDDHPALTAAAQFWSNFPAAPDRVDLRTNQFGSNSAGAGMRAVKSLSLAAANPGLGIGSLPTVAQAGDYYSSALVLLAHMAAQDRGL